MNEEADKGAERNVRRDDYNWMVNHRDAILTQVYEARAQRDAALADAEGLRADLFAHRADLQAKLSQWQVGHDTIKEELGHARRLGDVLEQENASLRDTVQQLRAKQIHADLPGILMVIQRAAEQARLLL